MTGADDPTARVLVTLYDEATGHRLHLPIGRIPTGDRPIRMTDVIEVMRTAIERYELGRYESAQFAEIVSNFYNRPLGEEPT